MISLFFLPVTLILGAVLGTIYFGGLWVTVRKLPKARAPVLLALGSFFGRLGIVLAGFSLLLFCIKDYAPLHLIACLGMFFWIRNRTIERLQPIAPKRGG
ncbi:ATP synthase subunit I [Tumidithrix elongata RA019]|uniref:ATP synthase subunit I n=1 Tax=Tumidithrix elongata BACA0141 TaxID=2716417 RepID=A0AAW9PZ39_9CYAN|nr:ATP synthase subunit I [Tumidithrix elongata RA019]